MRITIIGLGLIGGAAALAWKAAFREGRFPAETLEITAVDTRQATLDYALENGIADRVTQGIAQGVKDADLVLAAVPVLPVASSTTALRPVISSHIFCLVSFCTCISSSTSASSCLNFSDKSISFITFPSS